MNYSYFNGLEFLEEKIIKVGNYKPTGQKEVHLVDSALAEKNMLYLGFM